MKKDKPYLVIDRLLEIENKITYVKNEIFKHEAKVKELEKEAEGIMMAITKLN